jgi:hypothetical protein
MKTIPKGIEVLVKKAAVDSAFRTLLLNDRLAAAELIGLDLSESEVAVLVAIDVEQLEAIIERTAVPDRHRAVFLGKAAAAMLLALGLTALPSCGPDTGPAPTGIRPGKDQNETVQPAQPASDDEDRPVTKGIRPDRPPIKEEKSKQ